MAAKLLPNMYSVFIIVLLNSDSALSVVTEEDYAYLPPVFELDDFDRCMLLKEDALYCTIDFQLAPIDPEHPSEIWRNIKELSDDPKNYRHDNLRHGICIPFRCGNISRDTSQDLFKKELAVCYNKKYRGYGVYGTITDMHCQTNEAPPYDTLDEAVLFAFGAYLGLILFASLYDVLSNPKLKQTPAESSIRSFLYCFSLRSNWHRLTTMKNSPDTGAFKSIQGIRFYSMFSVMFAHAVMCILLGPIINTRTHELMINSPLSTLFIGMGPIIIQTFFVLSSWLLTIQILQIYEGKQFGIFSMLSILVRRYIRLTPSMGVMIAIHSTLPKHIVKGPFWYHIIGKEYENCRTNGWTNFLYMNNYLNSSKMCMSQSWYLAADTQLFVLGLLILYIINKFPGQTRPILGISLVTGVSLPGILCYLYSYDIIRPYPERVYNIFLNMEDWHVLYSSSYSNVGALVMGISFGCFFHSNKAANIINTRGRVAMFWMMSVGLCLLTIFSTFLINYPGYTYSKLQSAIWWSSTKNTSSFAIAVLIHGMTEKLGGIILKICCWKPVRFLGRLTYSAFLVHVFLVRVKAASLRSPIFISDYIFCYLTKVHWNILPANLRHYSVVLIIIDFVMGFTSKYYHICSAMELVTISYMFALVLCLTCEMPINALTHLWLPRPKPSSESKVEKSFIPKNDNAKYFNEKNTKGTKKSGDLKYNVFLGKGFKVESS